MWTRQSQIDRVLTIPKLWVLQQDVVKPDIIGETDAAALIVDRFENDGHRVVLAARGSRWNKLRTSSARPTLCRIRLRCQWVGALSSKLLENETPPASMAGGVSQSCGAGSGGGGPR